MSSTTRLLVLGVVKTFQPVHGYEVRRELISWRAQEWASVQPGSIYNALKSLTRDGYLEIVGKNQVGGRPERTTYRLTPAGDEEFRTLLREEWWTVRPPIDPLMAAVSFLGFVTRDEAIAALEHRTAQIHGMVRHLEFGIEAHDGTDSPYHVREMMRLMNARILAEVTWATQFLERLHGGEYSTASDPPWRPAPARSRALATRPARSARSARSMKPRTGNPINAREPSLPRSARAVRSTLVRSDRAPPQRKRDRRSEPPARTRGLPPGPPAPRARPLQPRTPRRRAPR